MPVRAASFSDGGGNKFEGDSAVVRYCTGNDLTGRDGRQEVIRNQEFV